MVSREASLGRILGAGLVAVIRVPGGESGADVGRLVNVCRALAEGGVDVAEITMTSPGALEAIGEVRRSLGDGCHIGVGSVLDAETARAAILAGARYVVTPVLSLPVIEMAHRYGLPVVCGALTPTEILSAWQAGADLVKVFPANHFGPRYFKDLLAPMPQLRLTPTGGVNLETAEAWLEAGAACLGVGSALVDKTMVSEGDWAGLRGRAEAFARIVAAFRGDPPTPVG